MGDKGTDERKVNQRGDHFGVPALDIAIGQDFDKTLFKLVM
jgi:hypothetical protein